MKKNVVKINENTIRKIVAESVKKAISESYGDSKDDYRNSYRMEKFNENLAGIEEALKDARYYCSEIMYIYPTSNSDKGRALKKATFYGSQEKMEMVDKYLKKVENLLRLVKQDVTGSYKETVANKDKAYGGDSYERSQEMRGPMGW